MWTGLILAGGSSRRMGRDKALLQIGGMTLLQRAVQIVRDAGGDPVVVGRPRSPEQVAGARQIDEADGDLEPGGPLVALHYGIRNIATDRLLALACDLPLLPIGLVRFLVDEAQRFDAVVPRAGGELHVLAAAYTVACRAAIERHLAAGGRSVHRILDAVRCRIVEEEELAPFGGPWVLTNVNSPEDLRLVESLMKGLES